MMYKYELKLGLGQDRKQVIHAIVRSSYGLKRLEDKEQ